MAEEQTGQERTEPPTERRKEEARKKGQVPRSRELNTMLSLLITGVGLWVLGGSLVDDLFAITISGFSVDRAAAFDAEQLPVRFMHMASATLLALAPLFAVTVVAALAGPLLMGGWSFSVQAMAFKLEKLDPVKGLGRVFSLKGLAELAKALIKFLLLMAVAYLMIMAFERDILTLSALTPGEASSRVVSMLVIALIVLSSAMVLIVMFDVPFELWNFNKQLRMTRQEVRDEMKETDGRPEVKQRIRNLQREVSQRRMMQDVPTADVVITNPTHVSIALSYADGAGAPRVVAKGRDLLALQIRTIATEHDVPLYEAPPLARALYASTEVGDEIPGDLYLAVARVLAYLFQLRRSRPTDYVPRPTDLDVPENYQHLMDEEPGDGDD
ncbi:flagellar biosynthesis protein FlhB [Congregibacter litoralis]|uniref:Flagellar biosynthetic protein FlhB n=1 Tax=Congregibacter litoralis KT71 TaxID=314285 RepID=A4A5Y3_9GAMM|nr:flagellar biosynthesis protein FlhB [Congregibacter litoralis]EAQ98430.1 flagellar biosynthetic protein FlhB [Congregibacter litoralis KT71]